MNREPTKQQKGFRLLDEETMKAVASRGGKSAHQLGRAHRWTSEEAKAAGKKGGTISRRRPKQPPPSA